MKGERDIVVIGAGIGGLGSALALARAGHRVTLVERDDTPMPDDVEGAFEWDRKGAPQVRHPHAFLGLAYTILRDRFPDVLVDLANAGVKTVNMGTAGPFPLSEEVRAELAADDDLSMLACRRTTFEWVLRRSVLAEANVTLRVGIGVAGLLVEGDSVDRESGTEQRGKDAAANVPVVTGVRLEDGSAIAADLVIASSGRRGDVSAWLAPHGVEITETSSDAGVVYFSRFYRSADAKDFGFRGGFGAGLIAGVIGADAGTYSITAIVDKNDRELRTHLGDSARFDATMRLLPELEDVAAVDGTPIHPVHCMTGLINRRRRFTDKNGDPLVVGFLACGDAHTCTNPAYGRGQSLALLQATLICDSLAAEDDLVSVGRRYEAACDSEVQPWHDFSVLTDSVRGSGTDPAGTSPIGASGGVATPGGGLDMRSLMMAAADNGELMHAVLRVLNLLEPPVSLLVRLPEFQAVAPPALPSTERRPRPPRPDRPTRDELLSVVA